MPVPIETPFGPMDAVADWLRANDVEPNDVPIEGPITIEEGHIRYAALLRNEAGRRYVDESTGEAAREERTVQLKIDPPENVQIKAMESE
ncbi:hypothetical protein ACWD1Z_23340 [Streptomyces sp. NPDC002784]